MTIVIMNGDMFLLSRMDFFEIKSEWYELDAFVENRIEGEIQLNLCCGIGSVILNVNDLVRHQRQVNKHIG